MSIYSRIRSLEKKCMGIDWNVLAALPEDLLGALSYGIGRRLREAFHARDEGKATSEDNVFLNAYERGYPDPLHVPKSGVNKYYICLDIGKVLSCATDYVRIYGWPDPSKDPHSARQALQNAPWQKGPDWVPLAERPPLTDEQRKERARAVSAELKAAQDAQI